MSRKITSKSKSKSVCLTANPKLPLSKSDVKIIDQLVNARTTEIAAQHDWAKAARPTASERRKLLAAFSKAANFDVVPVKQAIDEVNLDIGQRLYSHTNNPFDVVTIPPIRFPDPTAPISPPPAPIDTSFWWAQTRGFPSAHGLDIELAPDGEHFFGRVSYDRDDLLSFSAHVIASFVLDPARFPTMPTGRMNSEPRVDVFGSITGWTGLQFFPWYMDDKWCKCRLSLRQTAYQFYLGQYKELGTSTVQHQILDEDGKGYGRTVPMPGNIPMPALQIVNPATNLPITVLLEVRFDVQLEGNSFIGFSPAQNSAGSVLVRFSQWAPVPL